MKETSNIRDDLNSMMEIIINQEGVSLTTLENLLRSSKDFSKLFCICYNFKEGYFTLNKHSKYLSVGMKQIYYYISELKRFDVVKAIKKGKVYMNKNFNEVSWQHLFKIAMRNLKEGN